MRVVSLDPCATELVIAVGGASLLVGKSSQCAEGAGIPVVSADCLDEPLLVSLEPDVIVTTRASDAHALARVVTRLPRTTTVLQLAPATILDLLDDLLRVGETIGRAAEAQHAMVDLRARYWSAIDFVSPFVHAPEVLFLTSIDPLVVGGLWTPALIEAAGARHSLNPAGAPARRVTPEEVIECAPERIVLCLSSPTSSPLHALETLQQTRWWGLLPAVLDGKPGSIALVDGSQMFTEPSPRLVDAFEWLVGWINGREEVVPSQFPVVYPDRLSTH